MTRAHVVTRWHYTRHFLAELGPMVAVVFTLTGIVALCGLFWWMATCAVTLGFAPWCS